MPNGGTQAVQAVTEMNAAQFRVSALTGGKAHFLFAEVQSVLLSTGLTPSRAIITLRNASAKDEAFAPWSDDSGDFTPKSLKWYSRIKISNDTYGDGVAPVFIGSLVKRRENLSGASLTLEYWDDRWLLSKMPLHGCFVYDRLAASVKYIRRYMPHVNPQGYRNCIKVAEDTYVFAALAEQATDGKPFNDDDSIGSEDTSDFKAIYWTPERWLKYVRYFLTQTAPAPLAFPRQWCQLDETKLIFPTPSFHGDAMARRKMPDMDFTGQKALGVIGKTLDVVSSYGLRCEYGANEISYVGFYRRTKAAGAGSEGVAFPLQTSGAAADIKTVHDGSIESDAVEFHTGGMVHASVPLIEARFKWLGDQTVGLTTDSARFAASSLQPAWNRETEEVYFMRIIQAAQKPDGSAISGLSANTIAAVRLARKAYPKVFRAFRLRDNGGSLLETIMYGAESVFADHPALKTIRPVLEAQLQPYFEKDGVRLGNTRLPIRVQLTANQDGTDFSDVTANEGLRITPDGLIWFDGLSDDAVIGIVSPGVIGCTSLTKTHATYPKLKKINLNCAVPTDTRVSAAHDMFLGGALGPGFSDPNNVRNEIDESLAPGDDASAGPKTMAYVLNHDGFREEHQVTSHPVQDGVLPSFAVDGSPQYLAVDSSTGITKIVRGGAALPGNNTQIVARAAELLGHVAKIKRRSEWRMIGIRDDIVPGLFVRKIVCQPGKTEIIIDSPVGTVEHLPQEQTTKWTTE